MYTNNTPTEHPKIQRFRDDLRKIIWIYRTRRGRSSSQIRHPMTIFHYFRSALIVADSSAG